MFKTALNHDLKALKTCIRHDITAVKRPVGFMLLLLAASGLTLGLCMFGFTRISPQFQNDAKQMAAPMVALAIGQIASVCGLFIGLFASVYLGYWHMYQRFFTDQGYLTFTLPVKRSVLYVSKMITLALIELIATIIFILSMLWVALMSFEVHIGSIFNAGPFAKIGGTAGWWLVLWVPLMLVLVVVSTIASTGHLSLCIVTACVKKGKHRWWKGIGLFYLIFLIMGVAFLIPLLLVVFSAREAWNAAVHAGGLAMGATVTAILLAASMVIGCIGAIFHYTAISKLETRLNLS